MAKRKPARDYLTPLYGKVKRKPFLVYDIESKDGDTQRAGFTRPFMVGVYVPPLALPEPLACEVGTRTKKISGPQVFGYHEFRDEPHLRARPWDRRHILPGGCIDKTLTFVFSKRFSGYNVFAHNGGGFDHLFTLAWLREHEDDFCFEVIPVQSSIQAIRVWKRPEGPDEKIEDKWELLDSMRLIPFGLDRACKTFGLPGKAEQDLHLPEDHPGWGVYLKQDCVALATVLDKVHNMIESSPLQGGLGGEVGMTAPATAMKLFRRRFLGRDGTPNRIPRHVHWAGCSKIDCNGCSHAWIRRSYYGGRTELYERYGEDLKYFDLNSSYVSAMRETMPAGERMVEEGKLDWRYFDKYAGFCECTVEIPKTCKIPPLPYRHPKTGKLVFPVGKFSGVWSCEELKLLEDSLVGGRVLHVKRTVWFRRRQLFHKMVEVLWALRSKCLPGCVVEGCKGCNPYYDEGLSALAKLMGNSSYGKFGMQEERQQIVFSKDSDEGRRCFLCEELLPIGDDGLGAGGLCKECDGSKPAMGSPDADVWYQRKRVEAPYIIPQIASHITALARVSLWKYMRYVVYVGGKIFYLDTDSLITNIDLPTSTALGALKNEYPGTPLRCLAIQPKCYMIETMDGSLLKGAHKPDCKDDACKGCEDHKVTMKGFPRSLRTRDNLTRLRTEKAELTYKRLEKIRTLARDGFRRPPKMALVKRSFKTKYDKRVLDEETGTTIPIEVFDEVFGEDDEAEAAAE